MQDVARRRQSYYDTLPFSWRFELRRGKSRLGFWIFVESERFEESMNLLGGIDILIIHVQNLCIHISHIVDVLAGV